MLAKYLFRAALTAYTLLVLSACSGPLTAPRSPLPSPTISLATCADVDANWGEDWTATLAALEELNALGVSCGTEPLPRKIYAAHFNYATALEEKGEVGAALEHYEAAFLLDSRRQEALSALIRLDALPEPTPPICTDPGTRLPDPALPPSPNRPAFVTTENEQLILEGEVFRVRGVNYYPRDAPWHRFLEEADPAKVGTELDLIQKAGFNTIRIFLWYDPLFTCAPEDALPDEAAFRRVDMLLASARERDLRVIVTLNDLPDLTFRPLYTDWARYDAQTVYIVRRYRHEPHILAWDLRNEGDLDYGAHREEEGRFSEEEVLRWLAHSSEVVRENDPHHLLTAGWWGDPLATAPYVDLLSFHHWWDAERLQTRIETYQEQTNKPLLLEEIGYHSWATAPHNPRSERTQAELLQAALGTVEEEDLAGWVVWTAFDFVPAAGLPATHEHFFGLWRSNLSPKPALDILPLP
jgi:hypothetical protein